MDLFKIFGTIAVETKEAEEKLKEVSTKAKGTGDSFDDVDQKAKNLSNGGFSVLKGAAADLISSGFQRLISAMGQFVSSGVDYQMQLEQYTTSFETMTGSQEKAAEMTERLGEIAANTPFEMPTLADTTQLLMNYGFTADEAIEQMMMLGDISQGSADKMNRIASAYGQMSSAGKVSLEDIKQMIEAGFNPLQEISDATGESMESLYDRISKGTMSVDEITASMERSTSEGGKYFGSMDAQSETLSGRLSTLKDTAKEAFGEAFGDALEKASDWIAKASEKLEEFTEKIPAIKEKLDEAKEWVEEAFQPVIEVFGQTKEALQPVIDKVKEYFNSGQAASDGTNILKGALQFLAAALKDTGEFINVLIDIVQWLVDAWNWAKDAVVELATTLPEKWEEIKTAIAEKVASILANIQEKFEEIKTNIADKIASVLANITSKFQEIKNTISSKINDAKSAVQTTFENIRQAIADKISSAKSNVENTFDGIKTAISEKVQAAKETVSQVFDDIKNSIETALTEAKSIVESIWDEIKGVFSDAVNVGKKIIDDIKQGISDAWQGLTTWFNNLWNGLFGNRTVGVTVNANGSGIDGSHARGLDYVPFNGYIAELHKGEMVIPAEEASVLRKGHALMSNNDSEVVMLLRMIFEAIQDGHSNETVLKLNGREFGRLVRGVI